MKSDTPNELMKLIKVEPQDAIYGSLVFLFHLNQFKPNEVHYYKLSCVDINGVKRTAVIELGENMSGHPYSNPKYGLSIEPIK